MEYSRVNITVIKSVCAYDIKYVSHNWHKENTMYHEITGSKTARASFRGDYVHLNSTPTLPNSEAHPLDGYRPARINVLIQFECSEITQNAVLRSFVLRLIK